MDRLRVGLIVASACVLVAFLCLEWIKRHSVRARKKSENDVPDFAGGEHLEVKSENVQIEVEELEKLICGQDDPEPALSLRVQNKDRNHEVKEEPPIRPHKKKRLFRAQKQESSGDQQIYVLRVVAPEGVSFQGSDIIHEVKANGLRLGKDKIFYFPYPQQKDGEPGFYMANLTNPGTFEIGQMSTFRTRGLVLFQAQGSHNRKAREKMESVARKIAQGLGGKLQEPQTDETLP